MIVELHNRLRASQPIECTRVLVKDQYGNPIAVVVEQEPGQCWAMHCAEPGFRRALEAMGILTTTTTILEGHKNGLMLPCSAPQ